MASSFPSAKHVEAMTEDDLKSRLKETQKRVDVFNELTYRLMNFYFAFQGAILAVFLKSSLECDDMWIAYTLYGSVALFNLAALFIAGLELAKLLSLRDLYKQRSDYVGRCKDAHQEPTDKYIRGVTRRRYYVGFGICMIFFVLFTVFVYVAANWKLCGKVRK